MTVSKDIYVGNTRGRSFSNLESSRRTALQDRPQTRSQHSNESFRNQRIAKEDKIATRRQISESFLRVEERLLDSF
jgi:hypothetical protein